MLEAFEIKFIVIFGEKDFFLPNAAVVNVEIPAGNDGSVTRFSKAGEFRAHPFFFTTPCFLMQVSCLALAGGSFRIMTSEARSRILEIKFRTLEAKSRILETKLRTPRARPRTLKERNAGLWIKGGEGVEKGG